MLNDKLLYKITNDDENHHGYQFKDGLNELIEPFNNHPDECCAGGFYFTDVTNIFKFLDLGTNLRSISLPVYDPEFRMIQCTHCDRWKANKIILGEKRKLKDPNAIRMLIEQGADININNSYVLVWAIGNDYVEIIKLLLTKNINVIADNHDALCLAATKCKDNIIKLLLEVYDDTEISIKQTGLDLALSNAASCGNLKIIKMLINSGANIHANNEQALRLAASNGKLNIVKYLIKLGANTETTDVKSSAIYLAADGGHLNVVKYFVENKIDSQLIDGSIKPAIINDHDHIVKYLIEHGVNIEDDIIDLAITHHRTEIMDCLLNENIKINSNMINLAALSGNLDILKKLIRHDNAKAMSYQPKIQLISCERNLETEIIDYLLCRSIKIKSKIIDQIMPSRNLKIVEKLIRSTGAAIITSYQQAIQLASCKGNWEIVDFLKVCDRASNNIELLDFLTLPKTTFYKITNDTENHNGFQYKTGLNILDESFNSDPTESCCSGGFYFTDAKHIFEFLEYGTNLREVRFPLFDPNFKVVKDPSGNKWRANMIVLENKYPLYDPNTIKMLIESGADLTHCDTTIIRKAIRAKQYDIVKYVVSLRIRNDNDEIYGNILWNTIHKYLKLKEDLSDTDIVNCFTQCNIKINSHCADMIINMMYNFPETIKLLISNENMKNEFIKHLISSQSLTTIKYIFNHYNDWIDMDTTVHYAIDFKKWDVYNFFVSMK